MGESKVDAEIIDLTQRLPPVSYRSVGGLKMPMDWAEPWKDTPPELDGLQRPGPHLVEPDPESGLPNNVVPLKPRGSENKENK